MLFNDRRNRGQVWIIAVALVMLTAAVYAQVLGFDFTNFDDDLFVTENRFVKDGMTWESLLWSFTTTRGHLWHPAVWLSLMLDAEIYGLNPLGFHLTNLALHLANTLLLFGLLAAMTGGSWRSGFVAALFALHPLHVESVAWVAERKDVLSAFFWMVTLWAYWGYVRRRSVGRYLLVAGCFGAALLCKPMAVTLPVVMLLLDYWPLGRHVFSPSRSSLHSVRGDPNPSSPPRAGGDKGEGGFSALWRPALWVEKVPFLVMGVAVSGVALMAMPSCSVIAVGAGSLLERVQTAVVAYGFYLLKMLWPFGLSISYLHPGAFPMGVLGAAVGGLVCVSVLVVWGAERRPYLLMGWLWYLVTLFPVSGVFTIGAGFWMAADRYTYIPLVGPFVMIAWLVPELLGGWRYRRIFLAAAVGAVVVPLMVITYYQVGVWRNSGTLFEHAMRVKPGNWPAMRGMANFFEDNGRLDEAIPLWREALRLRPEDVVMRSSLARALLAKGQTEEAIAEGREMLRLAPASPLGHLVLAKALRKQGAVAQAKEHYERALELEPHVPKAYFPEGHYPEAHYGLAALLAQQGRLEEAISHYREAQRLGWGFPELHYNLGVAMGLLGRAEEAMSQYREALREDPAYTGAWLNLGILLGRQGKTDESVSCYRKVLSIKPDSAEAHYMLGSAYARQGKRDEALQHYRTLQALKPSLADALLREIEVRP